MNPGGAAGGFGGLHTDQAPPLAVPTSFYAVSVAAMAVAGALLASGVPVFGARALPGALVLTHLVTLGWLGSVMLGSIYQVLPVLAGVPVPWPRLGHGVAVGWVVGVAALSSGLGSGRPEWMRIAVGVLAVTLGAFLVPVGAALWRSRGTSATVAGIRGAVVALGFTAGLGGLLALGRAGIPTLGGDYTGRVLSHAGAGALLWVGALVAAVGWQVVPMFYLAPDPSPRLTFAVRRVLLLSFFGLVGVQAIGAPLGAVQLVLAPAAVAVLGVQSVATLRAIQGRKRKRADPSLDFWRAGLACAVGGLGVAAVSVWAADQRWGVALGWTLGVGFGGLVTHGMLCRIVPFLVWFHRFAPWVGRVGVPTMKELLPDARAAWALRAHLATFAVGLVAIGTGWAPLARVTGALLLLTAGLLGANLAGALRRRAPTPAG